MKVVYSYWISIFLGLCLINCSSRTNSEQNISTPKEPFFVVLGVAQDAGYPQLACTKECCKKTYINKELQRMVSCLGLVDPATNESWMFDATPDFTEQSKLLTRYVTNKEIPDGVFLTHGHIGHYTGIMYLGREALSAKETPVYVMLRMQKYLETNGPWSQLVTNKNIELKLVKKDTAYVLNKEIQVTAIQVPHRDEYTETVGFLIAYKGKKALFIPDVDKWEKWDRSVVNYIKEVDIAFLDATFFKNGEINRDMSEVPHPFVEESMKLFENLTDEEKNRVYFIHFNHTNPLLDENSEAFKLVKNRGFNVATEQLIVPF